VTVNGLGNGNIGGYPVFFVAKEGFDGDEDSFLSVSSE
jgi:hypothetical protein